MWKSPRTQSRKKKLESLNIKSTSGRKQEKKRNKNEKKNQQVANTDDTQTTKMQILHRRWRQTVTVY